MILAKSHCQSFVGKIARAGAVAAFFFLFGSIIGMGYFSKPVLPPTPVSNSSMAINSDPHLNPAILGAMMTEQRPDGQEWQSMVLTGRYNNDLDGAIHMSLYQEPANVLRARFEANARHDGWKNLHATADPDGRLEFYHDDGRVQIIVIDQYPNDLRSVTVFTGKVARRHD